MITRLDPTGSSVARGNQQGSLSVSRWQTSQLLWQHRRSAAITALAWSHDGIYLASGDAQGQIQIWEAQTGTLVQSAHGHHSAVAQLVWASTCYLLTSSASRESVLRIWDYSSLLCSNPLKNDAGAEARSR